MPQLVVVLLALPMGLTCLHPFTCKLSDYEASQWILLSKNQKLSDWMMQDKTRLQSLVFQNTSSCLESLAGFLAKESMVLFATELDAYFPKKRVVVSKKMIKVIFNSDDDNHCWQLTHPYAHHSPKFCISCFLFIIIKYWKSIFILLTEKICWTLHFWVYYSDISHKNRTIFLLFLLPIYPLFTLFWMSL